VFVAFVVYVVTEGRFTVAEIFPGSVSTFHKWFDGWTFCILVIFSVIKIMLVCKFVSM